MPPPAGARGVVAFERGAEDDDRWYEEHARAYEAELAALAPLVGDVDRGLEVGAGTGRFGSRLGLGFGVEPARSMANLARARGVRIVQGAGEALPFVDGRFDRVLMVAVVAFLADPPRALREARRVLAPEGRLVVGVLDRASPLWPPDHARRWASARFRTSVEVVDLLAEAGFELVGARQTIFEPPAEIDTRPVVREGAGEGLFAALEAHLEQQAR